MEENETSDFFIEISKDNQNNTLLLQTIMNFTTRINQMTSTELISFFQALQMLKKNQKESFWFFTKNPVVSNIEAAQKMVVQAMQHLSNTSTTENNLAERFNNIIEDVVVDLECYSIK